jgi:hypothetical protein
VETVKPFDDWKAKFVRVRFLGRAGRKCILKLTLPSKRDNTAAFIFFDLL